MSPFTQQHKNNIKNIFQDKTGVDLSPAPRRRHPLRLTLALAAVIALCLCTTVGAVSLFNSLDGDDLRLSAVYEGDGIVTVTVENLSDKPIEFQNKLKLKRWVSDREMEPSGPVSVSGGPVAPHSTGTLTIDLSGAYDLTELETPLTDDWYCLTLTNNSFSFGQDWQCSLEFTETIRTPIEYADSAAIESDGDVLARIPEELRFYFETVELGDIMVRNGMHADYILACDEYFADFTGNLVPPARLGCWWIRKTWT